MGGSCPEHAAQTATPEEQHRSCRHHSLRSNDLCKMWQKAHKVAVSHMHENRSLLLPLEHVHNCSLKSKMRQVSDENLCVDLSGRKM